MTRTPQSPTTRRCCRCRKVKPLTEFNRNRGMPLGRSYMCRPCTAAYRAMRRRRKRLGLPPLSAVRVPAAEWTERRCTTCGKLKPAVAFYRDSSTGGPTARCRACTIENQRAYRAADPERARSQVRRWHRANRDKVRAYEQGPERARRHAIRQMAFWAVRAGVLRRPQRCSRCGDRPPRRRLHAHHPDYSKPLDVVWLCSRCHGREHRMASP